MQGIKEAYCCPFIDEVLTSKRPEIMNELKKAGIGTSIYYPQPVPRMSYYKKKYGYNALYYANSAFISDSGIALPVGPHLESKQMIRIGEKIIETMKGY